MDEADAEAASTDPEGATGAAGAAGDGADGVGWGSDLSQREIALLVSREPPMATVPARPPSLELVDLSAAQGALPLRIEVPNCRPSPSRLGAREIWSLHVST